MSATLADMLAFYQQRGYRAQLGPGKRCALIVIDFSCAFTKGVSAFPGGDFAAELAATQRLLAAARGRAPIIFTTIAYQSDMADAGLWAVKVPWLQACQLDSGVVDIDPVLERRTDEALIVKKMPSAFHRTNLHEMLQAGGVDTILIAGCTTSVCVRATALDAMQHGYRPLVVRQAVGDFDAAIHALHLADLNARYADVIEIDAALTYLARG
jgi:nicotinamidase-related amidase